MSDTDTPTTRPGREEATEDLLPNFADLVIGMSRLLVGLSAMAPFRNADFSMADWVALSVLANGPTKNNRQLAKTLGVTRQRANQIKTSLEQARLVSAAQSTEDARQNVLTVTDRGRAQLEAINSELRSALVSSLKNKQRLLVRANKSIKVLMRTMRAGNEKAMKTGLDRHKAVRRRRMKISRTGA